MKDYRGELVSGADAAALELYEKALAELQCYSGDPMATIDAALAAAPDFVMAQVLKAYLLLGGTEAAGLPGARAAIAAGANAARTERESLHLAAAETLARGEYDLAAERFEDILVGHPRDVLALQVAHLFDFYRGDSRALRDRVARVLPEWTPDLPGYHAVLGLHAFGLEECGDYGRAEATGREAIERNPRDVWAHHAVAHVMEMQGRRADGVAWMTSREPHWAPDNFFAVHNWWHLALFHLDGDDVTRALALYDGPIRQGRSKVVLDMIDASALLWRLHLRGADVGARWDEIADSWAPLAGDGFYAFNDAHAMMAFVGAGQWALADAVIAAATRTIDGRGSNAVMTRVVGLPLCHALYAFGRGDYAAAVDLLRPVRNIAARFGGSHAQRDLVDLTLIEAADRDGQRSLVRALANERLALKPASPLNLRYRRAAREARPGLAAA